MAIPVSNCIKNRASNEEILTALKDVPNPNQEHDDGQYLQGSSSNSTNYYIEMMVYRFLPL